LQPTIRSRCQVVRLAPAPPEEAAKDLAGRLNLPPDQAMTLACLAGGDLERARAMHESGWAAERDAALRLLSEPCPETTLAVREMVEGAAAAAGRALEAQRGAIRRKLALLLACCRDLLVGGLTGSGELLLNRDASDRVLDAGRRRRSDHWQYLAEDFLAADDAVLANANLGLLLDLLFQRLSK
jgi:DNA polymerase III delta prime subunit